LSRDSGLTRSQVLHLANLPPEAQRKYIRDLKEKGKPPRQPRKSNGANMTVPTETNALVQVLVEKLGAEASPDLIQRLHEAIAKAAAEPMSGGNRVHEGETNGSEAVSANGRRGSRGKRGSRKSGKETVGAEIGFK